MGKKIGLDFGTTYSTLAWLEGVQYDEKGKGTYTSIKTLFGDGAEGKSPMVDSLLAVTEKGIKYGRAARTVLEKDHVYKAFKMLLSEKEDAEGLARLKHYNYDSAEKPKEITENFLNLLLHDFTKDPSKDIEGVVVGVPEIWKTRDSASKVTLLKILERLVGKGKVSLISEPELACMYFVNEYARDTHKEFKGHILLIDYGGGTLDLTICKIGYENGKPKVKMEWHDGEGENQEKKLGKAGFAFYQSVLEKALEAKGLNENDIRINTAYFKSVHEIENVVIDNGLDIKNEFDSSDDPDENEEQLCETFYEKSDGNVVKATVTYGMLSKAYKETNEGILSNLLKKAKDALEEHNVNYKDPFSDAFKIALVGGFSNFCLVQKTVEKTEGLARAGTHSDRRYLDFDLYLESHSEREKAIAYGAALKANDLFTTEAQAPYSLFLVSFKIDESGKKVPNIAKMREEGSYRAFKEYETIQYAKVYMVRKVSPDGKAAKTPVRFSRHDIPFIRVEAGGFQCTDHASQEIIEESESLIELGFSMDSNSKLTVHIYDYGRSGKEKEPTHTSKELDTIEELLGGILEWTEVK